MLSAKRTDPAHIAASLAERSLPPGFCSLPFVGLHISAAGSISPCCEYSGDLGNVRTTSLETVWTGSELATLREKFIAGEPIAACWKCADRERHESGSLRLEKLDYADLVARDEQSAPLATAFPKYLDLRLSNLCNFRCRTCWHGASSKWFVDGKAIGVVASDKAEIRSFDNLAHFETQIASGLDEIERIYFAGGEPLLMPEHYALLDMLISRGRTDVELIYTSNLSVTGVQGRSIFDLWSHFPRLSVEASVDGAGARGEFIRKEFDWLNFTTNVTSLRHACPHAKLSFGITVSVFNILTLPELLWALMTQCGATADSFHLHSLQEPPFYRTQILSFALKRKARDGIRRFLRSVRLSEGDPIKLEARLNGVLAYMQAEHRTGDITRFMEMARKLDDLRREDLAGTFPELAPLLRRSAWFWSRLTGRASRLVRIASRLYREMRK